MEKFKKKKTAKKPKYPKSITVIGKRWFDKVNGNTYCAARVYFDGVEVLRVPWTYGYGDFYAQVSSETVAKKDLLPLEKYSYGGTQSLARFCSENNINYLQEHSDGLKREMVVWGEK